MTGSQEVEGSIPSSSTIRMANPLTVLRRKSVAPGRLSLLVAVFLLLLGLSDSLARGTDAQTRPGDGKNSAQAHSDHPSHDATSRHPFDDVEKWVEIFDDPERAEWQKPADVVVALGLKPGQRVADLGAGTGYFSRFLAEAVGPQGRVYAIDTEPEMVEHLARRAERERTLQVDAVLAEPDDPGLPEEGVDLVLVVDTYHHIDDRVHYLERLAKRLRPSGSVAIIDFQKRKLPIGPPPEHKLARETVIDEFDEAGFRLREEPELLPYQYFLIFEPGS